MANVQLTPARLEYLIRISEILTELESLDGFAFVTIACKDKTVECHRLVLAVASRFFRTMLYSPDFLEERPCNVTLHDISAKTFQTILGFLYFGDLLVNSSNVIDLLKANEFLQMGDGIERRCVKFIEKYKISAPETLEMFVFACRTGKERLIDILSKDIAEHVKIFSANDSFLEISLRNLNIIVKRWSSLPVKNDEWLYGALVRWVFHKPGGRIYFYKDLFEVINFENLKSEYAILILKTLDAYTMEPIILPSERATFVERIKPVVSYDFDPSLSRDALQNPTKKLMIYFLEYGDNEKEFLKVCEVNAATDDYSFSDLNSSNPVDTMRWRWIRHVALDDGLTMYCLQSYTDLSTNATCQSFHYYSLVSQNYLRMNLESPPLMLEDVPRVCPLETSIYLYDRRTLSYSRARSDSTTLDSFNNEEFNRGIYVYNCELNKWFPVPPMIEKLQNSCMTACDRTLYLIGGNGRRGADVCGYAQAYDYRVGRWRALPETLGNYVGAECCSINNRIYVCGGVTNVSRKFERYDPRAGRWESLPPANRLMFRHQAISYLDRLYAVGGYSEDDCWTITNLFMEIYFPSQHTWNTVSFGKELRRTFIPPILDSVVANIY